MDVLVVEDRDDSREAMCEMLKAFGATARGARDGWEALGAVAQRRPDFILCDLIMPGLDGFELIRRIRGDAELRAVRVIAMTGWLRDDQAMAGRLREGFDGHLVKPIDPEALAAQLERILGPQRS